MSADSSENAAPSFEIESRRHTPITTTLEGDRLIIHLYGDIDTARITRKTGQWPDRVLVRVYRPYLEHFAATFGEIPVQERLLTITPTTHGYIEVSLPITALREQPDLLVLDWVDAWR